MPKKYTLEYVKLIFKEEGCKLLEKEYINCNTPMNYICNCDNISKISLSNFQNGKRCKNCASYRRKQTNIKRYGVEYPLQNKEIKEKSKKTNIKKYGVENPSQNKEIQEKVKQTNIKNMVLNIHYKIKK